MIKENEDILITDEIIGAIETVLYFLSRGGFDGYKKTYYREKEDGKWEFNEQAWFEPDTHFDKIWHDPAYGYPLAMAAYEAAKILSEFIKTPYGYWDTVEIQKVEAENYFYRKAELEKVQEKMKSAMAKRPFIKKLEENERKLKDMFAEYTISTIPEKEMFVAIKAWNDYKSACEAMGKDVGLQRIYRDFITPLMGDWHNQPVLE